MDDDEIRDWLPPELTNPAKDDVPQFLARQADIEADERFYCDCVRVAADEANPRWLPTIAATMMTRARVKRDDTAFFEWASIRDSLMADEQF